MLHQPDPNSSPDLLKGIVSIRNLHMRAILETGFACADEMLYPENHRYLSDLIAYVAEVIRKASVYGQYKCSINLIDDEYLWHSNKIDKRVDYKFEGMFTIEMAYEVERVFKSAGYYVKSCERVYYSHPQCYRTGKIELEWNE
jgi:hypothetical protein